MHKQRKPDGRQRRTAWVGRALSALLLLAPAAHAAESAPHPSAIRANQFAQRLVELSEFLQLRTPSVAQRRVGGYGGTLNDPEFYDEVKQIDAATGRVISIVQRERRAPQNLHHISVYIYDEQGRPLRDYSASYLPIHRRAPDQTLINLHYYRDDLYATRQYNTYDELQSEQCFGRHRGKPVNIVHDYVEIPDVPEQIEDRQLRDAYLACFAGIPATAGPYTNPLVEIRRLSGD